MTTYYIGADVHNNSTELAIEKRNKIVARYSVPTTIPAISNVLDSLQGKKYLAIEEEAWKNSLPRQDWTSPFLISAHCLKVLYQSILILLFDQLRGLKQYIHYHTMQFYSSNLLLVQV